MTDASERILTFERCFNLRDLGGYAGWGGRRVEWRRLFRSMTPQYMTEADAAAARQLGISLVIDFRGDRYGDLCPVLVEGGTRLGLSPPAPPEGDEEYERYRRMPPREALPRLLVTYGPQYARALQAIAGQGGTNVLFHCRLGKDRTGVFAALILKLLGVSDADVIEDYMLTEQQEHLSRGLLAEVEDAEETARREPAVAREPASRAAITAVLERLDKEYGGARGYFAGLGVSEEEMDGFIAGALEAPEEEAAGESSTELEYHYCEKLSYFREAKIRRFFRGGKEIAIVMMDGKLHAFSNRCTHEDFQLHFGYVEDGAIHCPIHYGVFDLATGKAVSGPVTDLETFQVRVEGDEVYVGVAGE